MLSQEKIEISLPQNNSTGWQLFASGITLLKEMVIPTNPSERGLLVDLTDFSHFENGEYYLFLKQSETGNIVNIEIDSEEIAFSSLDNPLLIVDSNRSLFFESIGEELHVSLNNQQNILNLKAKNSLYRAELIDASLNNEILYIKGRVSDNFGIIEGVHLHLEELGEWNSLLPIKLNEKNEFDLEYDLKNMPELGTFHMYICISFKENKYFISLDSLIDQKLQYDYDSNQYKLFNAKTGKQATIAWRFVGNRFPISYLKEDKSRYIFEVPTELRGFKILDFLQLKRRRINHIVQIPLYRENTDKNIFYFYKTDIDFPFDETIRADFQIPIEFDSGRIGFYYLGNFLEEKGKYYSMSWRETKSYFESIYITMDGKLAYVLNNQQQILNESLHIKAPLLEKFKMKEQWLFLSVSFSKLEDFDDMGIHIHLRKTEDWDSKIISPSSSIIKEDRVFQTYKIDLEKYDWEQFYQDFYVVFQNKEGQKFFKRLKNKKKKLKWRLRYSLNSNQYVFPYSSEIDGNYMIFPYITQSGDLSLSYRPQGKFETKQYKRNEKLAVLQFLFTWWRPDLKHLWLTHEKYSETAQDNSYYFFKYMYENHPEQKLFYVIDTESADYKRLKGMEDRVLPFMSRKHLYYLLFASLIVASESKGHGFSWRTSKGIVRQMLDYKPFVFLQHGVLGLKKIDNTFSAFGLNKAALFTTSSEFEKQIVMDYLGYREKNVVVTGLPRWDNLNHGEDNKNNTILIMPTWRNWLEEVEDKVFIESEYFKTYNSLISSKKLLDYLEKNDLNANFYLHPKFIQYSHLFNQADKRVNIIYFGDQPVNQLIQQATFLVTDYSSVAWEALYQSIPTVFYQFDQEQYLEEQGAYMDLKKDLFGPLAFNEDELIAKMEQVIHGDPELLEKMRLSQQQYFYAIDHDNSKRAYQNIEKNKERIEIPASVRIRQQLKILGYSWRKK